MRCLLVSYGGRKVPRPKWPVAVVVKADLVQAIVALND
jgi:hypothetical protein